MMPASEAARRAMQQNLDAAMDRLGWAIEREACHKTISQLIAEVENLERQLGALDWGVAGA